MPPLRLPLTRTFPLPSTTNPLHRTPSLLSIILQPATRSDPLASTPSSRPLSSSRPFSSSPQTRSSGSDSQYDPPGGWLFGVPPGEKYKNEGWERIWVWGFWGSLGVAVVAYVYKPDSSIQTWALEEARRRLEAEGILPDPATAGEPKKRN